MASVAATVIIGVLSVTWTGLIESSQRWQYEDANLTALSDAIRRWDDDRRSADPPREADRPSGAVQSADLMMLGPYAQADGIVASHHFSRLADGWRWERIVEMDGRRERQRLIDRVQIRQVARVAEVREFMRGVWIGRAGVESGGGFGWVAHSPLGALTRVLRAWSLSSGDPERLAILSRTPTATLLEWPSTLPPTDVLLEFQRGAGPVLVLELACGSAKAQLVTDLPIPPRSG